MPGASRTEHEGARDNVPRESRLSPASSGGRAEYELINLIGRGTVSEVWQSAAPGGALVAIKRLRPEWAVHEPLVRLLQDECELLERLSHPAIVRSLAWIESGLVAGPGAGANESPAIVLEYLPGGDLVSLTGAHPRHWVGAALALARALAYLHSQNIVHGDVKARNVLFDADEHVRLVDFSSAGVVGHVAPRRSGTLTQQRPRSDEHIICSDDDSFAFAALLYELCAGRPPYLDEASDRARPPALRLKSTDPDQLESIDGLRAAIMHVLTADGAEGDTSLEHCARALALVETQIAETED